MRTTLRVLIVDDLQDHRDILAMLLRAWGHDVQTAHDGPSALKAAQSFHPEVALLDIGMPGMSGWEVARRLRGPGLLLIAMSGYGTEKDKARSREAGFAAHLTKPSDLEELQRLLATVTLAGAA